jgi:hypothetical protein
MLDSNVIESIREEVKSELIKQEGMYNPNDRDTNVRIVENIRKAINELADGTIPSAQHIAEVAIATNENLQIRDFIMGVQQEININYVGEYITLLGNVIVKDKAVPLATVFCGYLYQVEEIDYAKDMLLQVLTLNPEYPLALLLSRVFEAEWAPSELGKMTQTLHSKVVDTIYAIDSEEVNNDN